MEVCEEVNEFPEDMDDDILNYLWSSDRITDYETFDDLETAKKFAELFKKGLSNREVEIYTQVDCGKSICYLRGIHVVNRTGVYLVIWK